MAGVLAVALLYALGRYTPVYALAFQYVPGINLFRRPIDGAFVLVAALALLAGQLLADYVREGTPRVARWRVAAVGLGALGVIGWAVLFSEKTHHGWASLWEVAEGGSRWRCSSSWCWRARGRRTRGRWPRPASRRWRRAS